MARRRYSRRTDQGLVLSIGSHEVPVVVSSDGEFWAEWEGESYKSTTFKGLRVKLLPKVRDDLKRCSVPAMMLNYGDAWEHVTLIGIHADNGNVLYLDREGKTHQERGWSRFRVYKVLTNEQLERHRQLRRAVKAAERSEKQFLKKLQIVPGDVVRAALGLPPRSRDEQPLDDDDDEDGDE